MKILYVAHVQSHLRNFHYWYLRHLKAYGYHVYVATHVDCAEELDFLDGYFDVPFERNPLRIANWHSYIQLRSILKSGQFDIVHCHTPIAGIVTRLASHGLKMKVYYTAHGFHFYDGAPLVNWLLYYPMEKIASYFTDVLFTMNDADFKLAQRKFKHPSVIKIHGAGFDTHRYHHVGHHSDVIRIMSIGELNHNKNHITMLKAIINQSNADHIEYYIAGEGNQADELTTYAALHQYNELHLLGFRKDIAALLSTMDLFAFPSFREGLPVSLMEAMASQLPCLVSDIRGNHDLIDTQGGILVHPTVEGFSEGLSYLLAHRQSWPSMGQHNVQVVKAYDYRIVEHELDPFYKITDAI